MTLHAKIDPQGGETTYAFEYAPPGEGFRPVSEPYGKAAGALPEGVNPVSIEVHVQEGLLADTTYQFRVKAGNSARAGVPGEAVSFTTQHAVGEFSLPDGRQYEQVTPAEKEGALFEGYTGEGNVEDIQASVDGDAMIDVATVPTEAQPAGNPYTKVSVLSTRTSAGWSSQVLAGAHDESAGSPFAEGEESRLFSEDLSHAITDQFGKFTPLSPQASEATPYLRTNYFNDNVAEHCEGSYLTSSSCFQPLVTAANTPPGTKFGGDGEIRSDGGVCTAYFCGPELVDATPDLSHIVLISEEPLTSTPGSRDYEWSNGQLQRLPGSLAGQNGEEFRFEGEGYNNQAARNEISANGERVILDGEGSPFELFEVATGETIALDAAEPECVSCTSGGGFFEGASSDDSRIFFLDTNHLTANSGAAGSGPAIHSQPDLYECEIVEVAGTGEHRCNLSDLTPPLVSEGESANVKAVLGVSQDGSYVYFEAGGVLAPGAVPASSECGHYDGQGGCNVYVRHDGVTRLVAPGWTGGPAQMAPHFSRVSPDGRWLAFLSPRPTGYDNRDALSGEPDVEVYLYHAPENPASESGTLTCASCDPTGARPVGEYGHQQSGQLGDDADTVVAAEVPGWTGAPKATIPLYQTRYLSDDGRLFFDSSDALVPQDVDGTEDVYEYEPEGVPSGEHACGSSSTSGSEVFKPAHAFTAEDVSGEEGAGCVALISAGTSSEGSYFLDASETGGDVFFATTSQLSSASDGGGVNVWDAHECTSASPCIAAPVQPPACTTEASCKAPPTPQPTIYGAPASATFSGPGNLAPPPPATVVKPKTKTVKCAKGKHLSHNKCVKSKHKKKKTKAKKSNRRAN